ncbi:penicillin-binding protein [Motilibacter rhizosphaerae]|uniref:Penicillin-binding protein n=1 Tax=Motilibacter rhizosphaerae TaxID=598652 RepID=A0A4Q7NP84_9ACTN|nr:right-handed parallel beta-helix repeat-containing protein [Motilibacter rhizosphaerae]RZS87079.1 penicillin-binding protein [Motilibacter rhizosphaerae]
MRVPPTRVVLLALAAVVVLVAGVLIGRGTGGGGSSTGSGPAPSSASTTPAPAGSGAASAPAGSSSASTEPGSSSEPSSSGGSGSGSGTGSSAAPTGAPPGTTAVDLGSLSGRTVSGSLLVTVPAQGVDSVRWLLDGSYVDKTKKAPFQITLSPAPGKHTLEARVDTGGGREDRSAQFTVAAPAPGDTAAQAGGLAAPLPGPDPAPLRTVQVSDTASLVKALAGARAGDLIVLADGTYTADHQLEAAADGTAAAPIVLRGGRGAVITTGSPKGGSYGLHVTGDSWRLEGFTVRNAKKGIVLDGSTGSVLSHLAVDSIGQEGIHFRSASAHGVVVDCDVSNTGLTSPQFGEGVYVGSATSNWGKYGGGGPDRSDGVRIEGNRISHTAAEGIDIKEGTTGGLIKDNVFTDAGTSGKNSADSWVDVKGNRWLVTGNSGSGTRLDAFQVHHLAAGWGDLNEFRGNSVQGGVPGVVVGVYPASTAATTVVSCDNDAAGAAGGVSNIPCRKG